MTQKQKNSLALVLAVSQWLALLIPGSAITYYGIGVTVILLSLLRPVWLSPVIQILLLLVSPYAAIRILLFSLWVPALKRLRPLPLRISVLLVGVVFLFLARFDQFSISVVFPGVMAAGAMVYAVSRVKGTATQLARFLTPYLLTILPYIVVFLTMDGAYRDRPASAMPLDLIQIVVAVVVIRTISGEAFHGFAGDASAGVESEHPGPDA